MCSKGPLDPCKEGAESRANNDVEEAVHTAVEAPEDDGDHVDPGDKLHREAESGVHARVGAEGKEAVESDGNGIGGVGAWKAIFEGGRARHGDSVERG